MRARRKVGIDSDEVVDVVNMKLPLEMFGSFGAADGVYPAYHMNKLHWISVVLSDAADDLVKFLVNASYEATRDTMGKTLSNSMVRSVHMLLHEAMDSAVREGLVPCNPTKGTTIPKNEHKEKKVLLESQIEKLIKAVDSDEIWRDFFKAELMTGMRRGEICGLKWEDFDEAAGTLHVRRSVRYEQGQPIIGETKTNEGNRKMILPRGVVELLQERKQTAISEWIFPNPLKPEMPMNPSSAYRRLKKLLVEANLPDITFHELRHTFATQAASNGIDPRTLASILGHTKASFTLDTYTHITTDMQKNAAGIVGNYITDIFGKELKPWQNVENPAKA